MYKGYGDMEESGGQIAFHRPSCYSEVYILTY